MKWCGSNLLQLAIGSTAISMGILLATLYGRPLYREPVVTAPPLDAASLASVCPVLRPASPCVALLALMTLPLLNRVYVAAVGSGLGGHADARGSGGRVVCCQPTILMGASLPAIVRLIKRHAFGHGMVGLPVRRQHGGSGDRMPPGGLLLIAGISV